MNNKEIKDGFIQPNLEGDFIAPQGLSLPTQSYDSYAEHLKAEEELLADWDDPKYVGQPSVAMNKDPYLSDDYRDEYEMPIQELEEGGLPSLPTLNHRRLS